MIRMGIHNPYKNGDKMRKYIKESLKYLLRTRLFIHKYMDEINAMYDMTPEELRERNERRFLKIFRKAYFRSEYYRRLCLAEGVKSADEIQHLEDIIKLPILTKDMLKAHGKGVANSSEMGLDKESYKWNNRNPAHRISRLGIGMAGTGLLCLLSEAVWI